MIYPSIDKLLNKVGSKYLLVNVVARRAKEIKETNYLQMPEEKYNSTSAIGRALEEVNEGFINIQQHD